MANFLMFPGFRIGGPCLGTSRQIGINSVKKPFCFGKVLIGMSALGSREEREG
jgi:hypothetical protein